MRILIFLASLIYGLCLTKNYYKNCLAGTSYIDILSVNECRAYDPEGGYCCFLDYDNDKVNIPVPVFLFYKKKENETNIRSLQEPQSYCYGISYEGYDNINDVIEELIEETGINQIRIDCGNQGLKFEVLKGVILLLIFLIL